jgi:GNAT superfamily N-acetyltransferase
MLRDRINRGHAGRSIEFLATKDSNEAGFLSYEDRSDERLGFIYEIFVLPPFRNRGVGAYLLQQAERYAIQLNCNVARLKPFALDDETDQNQLIAWYKRMGYLPIENDQKHFQKMLEASSAA